MNQMGMMNMKDDRVEEDIHHIGMMMNHLKSTIEPMMNAIVTNQDPE